MKSKKFLRLFSAVLAMIMVFGISTSVTTSAATDIVTVTVRVEGLSECFKTTTLFANKGDTLKSLIDSYLSVTYSSDTGEIKTVEGENTYSSSSWQYAVDGEIKNADINNFILNNSCDVVIFNGTKDCVYPTIHAGDISLTGVIQFTGKNASGVEAPIAGATVSWSTGSGSFAYKTDKNGKIYISESDLTEGSHSIQITSTVSGVPNTVRLASGTTILVEKQETEGGNNTSILQQAYDFVYSILMGIYEGFMFYVKTIIGWFN